ncbi:hypothetical protein BpHYR1_030687 [Brachionus plicatilis]|uniref:Uncharacterized protein n=1 Tax=Brachionus plicatilis TaxID=10195 RepID=A0A3M7PTG7_BRAPC|nr:hypothetical protein BpHYR1_030687 [Brachionus plicatilis]
MIEIPNFTLFRKKIEKYAKKYRFEFFKHNLLAERKINTKIVVCQKESSIRLFRRFDQVKLGGQKKKSSLIKADLKSVSFTFANFSAFPLSSLLFLEYYEFYLEVLSYLTLGIFNIKE